MNVPFADGHAKSLKVGQIETKDFGFYQKSDGQSRNTHTKK